MVFPATAAQLAALLGNHVMTSTVTVLRGSTSLGSIPFIGGRITATYSTQGGRDGSLTVDKGLIDAGYLNPLSDQVIIRTGIPGFLEVPIFTGRPDDTALDLPDGQVEVPLLSRGAEAIRAGFETPWGAIDNNQAKAEITRILQDVDATWTVDVSGARDATIGTALVWEDDRGQALDQLALGASLIWQPNRTGGFTVYTNPYFLGPDVAPSTGIILRDGTDGVMVSVQSAKSRQGIYNSVTVVAERYGNQVPIRVTVRDNDMTSPTFWGGLFGKQNLIVKSQLPIDVNGATDLAKRILRQSLALQRNWTITTPHFPLLDPGDVFTGWTAQDGPVAMVAESIDYPLMATDTTVIQARELRQVSSELMAS